MVPFGGSGQGATGPSEEDKKRTQKRVLSFALSDDGAFIRELLVEEVAKVRPCLVYPGCWALGRCALGG